MIITTLNKSVLRKLYLEKRQSFRTDEIEQYSKTIFDSFVNHFDLSKVERVHCFLPIKKFNEINTLLFIEYFWENNIEVYVPKIVGDEIISVKFDTNTDLLENSWGILEPLSNTDNSENIFDLIITPLLYCDKKGNRVGYGKGFYDRFFKKINLNALKIGINYFDPDENIADFDINDVKLNCLITMDKVYRFD